VPSPIRGLPRTLGASLGIAVVLLLVVAPTGRAASPPVGPLGLDRALLSNLSAPSVAPGATSTLGFRLADPSWFGNLTAVTLTFQLYALNGYPGDAVGPLPVANAPLLATPTSTGRSVNLTLATLERGTAFAGTVSILTSSSTPAGTYAVRTALSFHENASVYRYESRGWFSASAWANATKGPGGTATVNASLLNVSGILPETAVYVAPSTWPLAIGALVAAGLIVVALGAWLYFRNGPGSRSGAAKAGDEPPRNAPKAFGTSRSNPGDSRSS